MPPTRLSPDRPGASGRGRCRRIAAGCLLPLGMTAGGMTAGGMVAGARAQTLPDPGPYEALGVQAGMVLLFPSVEMQTRHSDNVRASATDEQSDLVLEAAAGLAFRTLWALHDLSGDIRVRHRTYTRDTASDATTFQGQLGGVLAVTADDRISLDATLRRQADIAIDSDIDPGLDPDERVRFDDWSVTGSWQRQVNRIAFQLSAATHRLNYAALTTRRDRQDYRTGLRLAYALSPSLSAYVEPSLSWIDFDIGSAFNSRTASALVGARFDLSTIFQGDVGIGGFRQTFNDETIETRSGVATNARVTWNPTQLTAVTLRVSRRQAPSTRIDGGRLVSSDIGLRLEHALADNLDASLGGTYRINAYGGERGTDHRTDLEADLRYRLNRNFGLTLGVQHRRQDGSTDARDFTQTVMRLALTARI